MLYPSFRFHCYSTPEYESGHGCAGSTGKADGASARESRVRLIDGTLRLAEIHWYEAHGIGRREFKLKLPFLDAHR